ncbi:MAG: chemotaxis protein CheA [Gammaproteobacteria bacterium]|nr:chemotaxis protein CheA [Gammaproteobacteria bacterium]
MSIDISQFLATFYEESFEGLDIMESELLNLDSSSVDDETINNIFRAAHSIKGGSGTFGLKEVSNFTHVLETLLDEMRSGKRKISQPAVELMLTSVDVIREMMKSLQSKLPLDQARINMVHAKLEEMLSGEEPKKSPEQQSATSEAIAPIIKTSNIGTSYKIKFTPKSHLFRTGNDPLRILAELSELGDMEVIANLDKLPHLEKLNPENSYLAWEIMLHGVVEESAIKDVFSWVEDDADITIETVSTSSSNAQDNASALTVDVISESVTQPEVKAASGERDNVNRSSVGQENAVSKTDQSAVRRAAPSDSGSIRVGIDKVDALIDMVGELVITQSMLNQIGEKFTLDKLQKLQDGLVELERHTRELQENVMRIRMLPISFAFNRFPRLVHDIGNQLGKKVELKLSGESTELDKTVMERIGDPLVHLVRNSLDHGIELPEKRRKIGKPETGHVHLNAFHQGGNIIIEITDDGAGIDTDKIRCKAIERGIIGENDNLSKEKTLELIFAPGLSTAEQVSDISGRGVGMDVVRRNINELGGTIEIISEIDVGTTFRVRLPLTLAILDGQLVRVGSETFIVPLVSIIESLQVKAEHVKSIAGDAELYRLRNEYIPVIRLHKTFNIESDSTKLVGGLLVVVEGEGRYGGIFVDELLGQQQVVIKSLESNFKKVEGISGATILGDGTVALIVDTPGLIKLSKLNQHSYSELSELSSALA